MKRRGVLAGLGALATLPAVWHPAWAAAGVTADEAGAGPLAGFPPEPGTTSEDAWRAIGMRYLDTRPSAARVMALLDGLQRRAGSSPTPACPRLRGAVRDDFRGGRVLVLDGWILSRTEVALGLAAALTASAPPPAAAGSTRTPG